MFWIRNVIAAFMAAGALLPGSADANVYSATANGNASDGSNYDVSAQFTITGTGCSISAAGCSLEIVLSDSGHSLGNPSILSGLYFSTDVAGNVNAVNPLATATQGTWTGSGFCSTAACKNFTGGWAMYNPGQIKGTNVFTGPSYGLGAAGYTGSASNLTLGNGGPNYGIVGTASCPANSCTTGSQVPFAISSITFEIANFVGNAINSVEFAFGSLPEAVSAVVTTTNTTPVPEPRSTALLLTGLFGLAAARRFRKA